MRYLLLDRITHLTPPETARGVKCVSLADDVFADHFPGHPVMPGALIIEGLAELGGALLEATMRQRGQSDLHALLTMVERARFRQLVRPGDRLDLVAAGLAASEDGGRVRGLATVDGHLAAEAELTFAFVRATDPALLARRRELLDIWLTGSAQAPPTSPDPGRGPGDVMSHSASASIVIQAPRQRVWQAITDPALVKQYFFGTNLVTDWKVGSPLVFGGEWEGKSYEDRGTVLSFEPPRSLSFNYWSAFSGNEDRPELRQIIRYDLDETAAGVRVSVHQSNVDTQERADHSAKNWQSVLAAMKKLLEENAAAGATRS
jgi:3-hydroxymyristoyl/3-hydroxydecanoyl-(acyl carrier protein) dehydratase/uncharacterized protein YndB with AHSA1/START domain